MPLGYGSNDRSASNLNIQTPLIATRDTGMEYDAQYLAMERAGWF
jgi:hypothetical protein